MTDPAQSSPTSRSRTRRPGVDLVAVLEERVQLLVESYRKGKHTIQDLRGQIAERDQRIRELSKRIETSGRLRNEVRRRIVRLVHEVEKLEHNEGKGARPRRAART